MKLRMIWGASLAVLIADWETLRRLRVDPGAQMALRRFVARVEGPAHRRGARTLGGVPLSVPFKTPAGDGNGIKRHETGEPKVREAPRLR